MFNIIKLTGIMAVFAFITVLKMNADVINKDLPLESPTITTNPVLTMFCAGEKFNVTYTVSADFDPGNVFTAQISDAMGGFSSPTAIGTLNSATSGSILVTLPKNLTAGFGYRIRVISSLPPVIGSDNGENITINPLPEMNIDGNFEPCYGQTYNYTTSTVLGFTYQWIATGGEIQGNSTLTSIQVLWGNESPGTLQLIKQDAMTGCVDTMTVLIDIKFAPETIISWGKYEVCAGEVVEYTPAPSSVATNSWSVQGGTIIYSDASKARVRWNSAGEGWIEMQKTNEFGCVGKDKRTVTVNPSPVAQISGSNNVYSGKKMLYKSMTEPGSSTRWHMRGGTSQDSTADSVFITWGQPGQGWLRLVKYYIATDCSDTAELNITINPSLPVGEIEGKDVVCSGNTEAYSTEQVDSTYIKWYVKVGTIVGADNGFGINVTWETAGIGEVKYILTEFGSGNKDSTALDVTINQTPVISFPELDDICINGEPLLLNTAQPEGGAYSGMGVDMDYFYPDRAGVGSHEITYSFTAQNGCQGIQKRTITVNPKPEKPVITITEDGFISNYDYGNQWFESGQPIEGATGKELTNPGSGYFSVQVTDSNGCVSDMSDGIEVDVEEYKMLNGIKIYPNPVKDLLYIENKTTKFFNKIEIIDLIGNLIYSLGYEQFSANVETLQRVNLNKINNGFYIIKFYFSDFIVVEKLIISR